MRWFLRTSWFGIRTWGIPMTLGVLFFDLVFAKHPPAWPMPALFKYPIFALFCGVGMGLYMAWRASVQRGRDAG